MWAFCGEPVPRLMLLYFTLHMVLEFTDGVIFPLWASAPVAAGGLGFLSRDIGSVLAVTGAAVIVGQVLFYPPLHARFGSVTILKWWPVGQTVCYVGMALTPGFGEGVGRDWVFWAGALFSRFRAVLAEMCFSSMSLALNYAVPASRRGAYNGFGSAVSSIGRMVGPSLGAPLFAWSITNELPAFPLGRCLMMGLLVCMCLALAALSCQMPASLNRPCGEDGATRGGETTPRKQR